MSLRLRQVLFVGAGAAIAVVMLLLGLWQMSRSISTGDAAIAARADQAPIPLLANIHTDGTFGDVYGKKVMVSGTYLPAQQLLVVDADGRVRLLTPLAIADGRVVPVVRGSVVDRAAAATALAPPTGEQAIVGIFLPGEGDSPTAVHARELASVRTPLLAQFWPQQVTPGFVTLDATASAAQGLGAASVTLPHGDKSLLNGSYALQWWLFAAFALGFGIKMAHDAGTNERRKSERSWLAVPSDAPVPLDNSAQKDI